MSNEIISPNMGLVIPGVGTTSGPLYASDVNTSLSTIDSHDHTSGRGAPISQSSIALTGDFPFSGFGQTAIGYSGFQTRVATLSGAYKGFIYESGVDLYYNDGNGTPVRLTQGGSIAGSPGSISGLVSPASAAFALSSTSFIWQSSAGVAASMDFASAIFRNTTVGSHGLTLAAPGSMATNYTVVLPAYASTLATIAGTETLTNKTLNNSTLTGTSYVNGLMGIGTNSPSSQLDISADAGNVQITHTSGSGNSRLRFIDSTGTKLNWQIASDYNATGFEITHSTGLGSTTFSSPSLFISDSGYVGIGTITPNVPLTIGLQNSTPNIKSYITSIAGATGGITFHTNHGGEFEVARITPNAYSLTVGSQQVGLDFWVDNNGTMTQAMAISHDGKIGIGTSTPSRTLDVGGETRSSRFLAYGGVSPTSAGSAWYGADAAFGAQIIGNGTTSAVAIYDDGGNPRITVQPTTGYVGISNTSPSYNLDITGTLRSSGNATLHGINVTGYINAAYTGGEVSFPSTSSSLTYGMTTYGIGNSVMWFDHRGTSNTGSFIWRNGTNASNTLMTLWGPTGVLTCNGGISSSGNISGGQLFSGGVVNATTTMTAPTGFITDGYMHSASVKISGVNSGAVYADSAGNLSAVSSPVSSVNGAGHIPGHATDYRICTIYMTMHSNAALIVMSGIAGGLSTVLQATVYRDGYAIGYASVLPTNGMISQTILDVVNDQFGLHTYQISLNNTTGNGVDYNFTLSTADL